MRVVSSLKGWPFIAWTVVFAGLGAFVLYRDLMGEGLRTGTYYLLLGPLIYPVFYGAVIYALLSFTRLFRQRRDYLGLDSNSIIFGKKLVPLTDVRDVLVGRNWLGLRQLVVARNEAKPMRLASYFLTRPTTEVASVLKEAVQATR